MGVGEETGLCFPLLFGDGPSRALSTNLSTPHPCAVGQSPVVVRGGLGKPERT